MEDGEAEDCNFIRTVRQAAYGVRDHTVRVCNVATLTAVKGIGPTLIKVCSPGSRVKCLGSRD